MPGTPDPGAVDEPMGAGAAPDLARELGGDLPCAACAYNLRGLSVRSVCPECGTPVRATILATVDPYADVLRPITCPWVTAAGILVWSFAALGAALLTWWMRLADAMDTMLAVPVPFRGAPVLASWLIAASGVAALVLVRPHAGIAPRTCIAAFLGAAATVAAAWVYWRLHVRFDAAHVRPYFVADAPLAERTQLRLAIGALLVAALFLVRPNARLLAARSLLMRLGWVDRQTLRAMAAALAAAAMGDVLYLLAPRLPGGAVTYAVSLGNFLIAVGSMLFTVGLVGVAIDCLRIAPVLVRPPLSMARVMHDGGERSGAVRGAGA
jgi:hypothetical protein